MMNDVRVVDMPEEAKQLLAQTSLMLQALVDLLISKDVILPEEFHTFVDERMAGFVQKLEKDMEDHAS